MKNGTQILKGALHVHTELSHDGIHTLEELKSFFQRRGYNFVCLTDHSQDVNPSQYALLQKRCVELSDDTFVLIPGLEYSCEGQIHIMGIGIKEITDERAHAAVIDHIRAHGGMAVLAHPTKSPYHFRDDWLKKLDGAEIWNRVVDSLFLPQVKSIKTFDAFRELNPKLCAVFGLDLHKFNGYSRVGLLLHGVQCNRDEIVEALRAGEFVCWSPFLKMRATSSLAPWKLWIIGPVRALLNVLRVLKGLVQR